MKKGLQKEWIALALAVVMVLQCFQGIRFISQATNDYTEFTFSDAGTVDLSKASMIEGTVTRLTSMDKTAFRGNVTYKSRTGTGADANPWNDRLYVGVNNYWGYAEGGVYIFYNHSTNQIAVNGKTYAVPTELGSLIGKTVEYYITFDAEGTGTKTVIYINNVEIVSLSLAAIGTGIHAYSANGTMTIESVASQPGTDVPTEYQTITFGDAGTIDLTKTSMIEGKVTSVNAMDGVAFRGKVTYKDRTGTAANSAPYNDRLYIGVNNYWGYAEGGLYIYYNHNADVLSVNGVNHNMPEELGDLIGKTVEYYITFDKVGTSTEVVICIDNVQVAKVQIATVGMGIHAYSANGTMTIESVIPEPDSGDEPEEEEKQPIEQKTPEELGYTKVVLDNFGLDNNVYSSTSASGNHHFGDCGLTTLDNTYLDVNLKFENATSIAIDNSLRYLSTSGWHGIQIGISGENFRIFSTRNSGAGHMYVLEELPVATYEESFNVKLGVKIGTDKGNGSCDITYDLWIADVRVAAEAVLENVTISDIGTGLGIYTPSGTLHVSSPEVEKEPIEQKTPEELGYTQIRLIDFLLSDGTYHPEHKNGNHHFGQSEFATLHNTYFDVNMAFANAETIAADNSLRLASTEGWRGIQIGLAGGELKICNAANRAGNAYTKEELNLTTFEKNFHLKLGIKVGADKGNGVCDVTYDLWINNVRVAAEAVLTDVHIADIGTGLGIYTPSGTIVLSSPESVNKEENVKRESLPSSFRTVTFHSFGISDNTYKYSDGKLCAYGDFALKLDKTIFSADVYFSNTKGGDFRYAGKENEWCGLHFYNRADGKLYMKGVKGDTGTYEFHSLVAGVELTDNWYNLKLTTEFVDSDKDGKKDDVKLGVWFNNVLYDNEYIYLQDYVQHFGKYTAVYVDKGEGYISVKSDTSVNEGIDFKLFGFTKNWVEEVGL